MKEPGAEQKRYYHAGIFLLIWTLWLIALLTGSSFLLAKVPQDTISDYLISGATELLLVVPAVIYILKTKTKLSQLFGKADAGQICAALLLGALMLPATLTLSLFWNLLITLTGGTILPQGAPVPQSPLQMLVACAVMGLAAPLVEEPIMRGIVLQGQSAVWGRNKAVFFTSLLFVLPHGQFSGFAAMLLAGGVITLLAWRTGSLWPSMAAHFSFNVASVSLMVVAKQVTDGQGAAAAMQLQEVGSQQILVSAMVYLLVSVPFMAVCGVLLWAVWKHTPAVERLLLPPDAKPGLWLSWPWLLAGVLMAGLLLLNMLQVYGVIDL